jgi:radical SAM superfamily enzyme YgiQ (UPF0313 family)
MNILLVYPKTPQTFWSFNSALKFVSKKSTEPPLGIITIAAMLPKEWNLRLIDMNVTGLKDNDILWADYVFLSGMSVQVDSFREVVRRCNVLNTKIVAGGPLATVNYDNILGVDHFILNEAEITLPLFLKDLENGNPKKIYKTNEFPDISTSPTPRWDLLDMHKYATMAIQYSRGCPYDCDFCTITMLNGRKPRTKNADAFIEELEKLYKLGWRGDVSIVDDNFIGKKSMLKNETLPALIEWSKKKNYPFAFVTEATVNLADDIEMMRMMIDAGFFSVFVGVETPNTSSLEECGKGQNRNRDLVDSIKRLQNNGFVVSAGFIVGFDSDPPDIFDRQIEFIQQSGITTAMVGVLNAPGGTKLYKRLQLEKRIIENFSGNNTDGTCNFIPKMEYKELIHGYAKIIKTIYAQREYYKRIKTFLHNYAIPEGRGQKIRIREVKAFIKILWKIGILESGRKYFWKLLWTSVTKYPKKFALAMTLSVYGFHFRKVAAAI